MSGWAYAFGQNLVLLAIVAILGMLVGLLVERARAAGRSRGLEPGRDADLEAADSTELVTRSARQPSRPGEGDATSEPRANRKADERAAKPTTKSDAKSDAKPATKDGAVLSGEHRNVPAPAEEGDIERGAVAASQPQRASDSAEKPGKTKPTQPTQPAEPADAAEPTELTELTELTESAELTDSTGITEPDEQQTSQEGRNQGPRTPPRRKAAASGSLPVHDDRVAELQRKLDAARAHVEWLSVQMKEVEGQAAVEYGRLEAAALRALDETISADQLRIQRLQEDLAKSQAEQTDYRQHLVVSEQRFESLRAALADRDVRIAELDNELKQLRRLGVGLKVKEGPR